MTLKLPIQYQNFAFTIDHEQSRPWVRGLSSPNAFFYLWLLCSSTNNSFTANCHVDTCPLGTLLRILVLFHKQLQIHHIVMILATVNLGGFKPTTKIK